MSICKNCIRKEMCINYIKNVGLGNSLMSMSSNVSLNLENSLTSIGSNTLTMPNNEFDGCIYFKDRSKLIEPPCELGDRLYAINGKGEIKSWKIIYIRAVKSSIRWNPEHIEYTIGCEKNHGIMWIKLDKSKNIYFKREEAEQALKRRKKNEQ